MKLIYQTVIDPDRGNCLQTSVASLLDLDPNEVPDMSPAVANNGLWFDILYNFLKDKGYEFIGTLYNPNHQKIESPEYYKDKEPEDRFKDLNSKESVNGYFIATVYSPKFFNETRKRTHAVIIDKNFNIINPINKDYIGMKEFPLSQEIKYNGILSVFLINKIK